MEDDARVDTTRSPFYEWLDHAAIRGLLHQAVALPVGERLILLKGLVPSLVDDLGEIASGSDDASRRRRRRPGDAG
jgi:hypothetical protein